jgi:hypothetical protein
MTDGYGRITSEFSESLKQSGQSQKMLKACLALMEGLSTKPYAHKWKTRVTKSGLSLFQLVRVVRPIGGTAFGCLDTVLMTPQAIDGQGEGRAPRLKKDMPRDPSQPGSWRADLKDQVAMLPTPRVSDTEGAPVNNVQTDGKGFWRENKEGVRWGVKVKDVVAMLPTPKARDWKGETQRGPEAPMDGIQNTLTAMDGITKASRIGNATGNKSRLRLAPEFCLWMMGLPKDYLDLPKASKEDIESYLVAKKERILSRRRKTESKP